MEYLGRVCSDEAGRAVARSSITYRFARLISRRRDAWLQGSKDIFRDPGLTVVGAIGISGYCQTCSSGQEVSREVTLEAAIARLLKSARSVMIVRQTSSLFLRVTR